MPTRYGCPVRLRLMVLGVHRNILAITRNEWPWARPRLRVSHSSTLRCVELFVRMATPSPNRAGSVALGVRTQACIPWEGWIQMVVDTCGATRRWSTIGRLGQIETNIWAAR